LAQAELSYKLGKTKVSGETVSIGGSINISISGQPVSISGQFVDVSGQPVSISGETISIASGLSVIISGQPVRISGETVTIAGGVNISGFSVDISGELVSIGDIYTALQYMTKFIAHPMWVDQQGTVRTTQLSGLITVTGGSITATVATTIVNVSGIAGFNPKDTWLNDMHLSQWNSNVRQRIT
jgi:hypothetical protein